MSLSRPHVYRLTSISALELPALYNGPFQRLNPLLLSTFAVNLSTTLTPTDAARIVFFGQTA